MTQSRHFLCGSTVLLLTVGCAVRHIPSAAPAINRADLEREVLDGRETVVVLGQVLEIQHIPILLGGSIGEPLPGVKTCRAGPVSLIDNLAMRD